jgi:hypothetical protein
MREKCISCRWFTLDERLTRVRLRSLARKIKRGWCHYNPRPVDVPVDNFCHNYERRESEDGP